MDKKKLREIKWQQRKVFPERLKTIYDQKILNQLKPLLQAYQSISTFVSIKDEIDTRHLIAWCLYENKVVSIPKTKNKRMTMNLYTDELIETKWGLIEPTSAIEVIPEVVIVPLLAFNDKGFRIGYGGGYYDRYLKDHQALTIGLAYSWMLEDFEGDPHDISLDLIVTENEIKSFNVKSHSIT